MSDETEIVKQEIKSCCGKRQIIWKLPVSLQLDLVNVLNDGGFNCLKSFTDAGLLYAEDKNLIATGVFGLNKLRIKCKTKSCDQSAVMLEVLLVGYK